MSTEAPWLDEDEQRVWRQWLAAHAQLFGALARQLNQDSSLSMPDFEVLVHLSEEPGHRVRVAELASRMQWERSRLSHQLTRMEKRGLVAREECPSDRRGAFAVLTESGLRAIEDAAPGHVRTVRSLFLEPLSEAELRGLGAATSRILARVSAVEPTP